MGLLGRIKETAKDVSGIGLTSDEQSKRVFDGSRDSAVLISQEWEEVRRFPNLGNRKFRDSVARGSTNGDYGSSGLDVAEMNRAGRT